MSQTVFITGASSGIGEALAYAFAEEGYDLALMARRQSLLEQIKNKIICKHSKIRVAVVPLDVADYATVPLVFQELLDALGQMDIFVANAGISKRGEIGKGNFTEARQVIETNLIGAMATIDYAVQFFRQQGYGQVVGISSFTAFRGLPSVGAYSASKAALATYLEAARIELSNTDIGVTVLYPGYVDTPMVQGIPNRFFEISPQKCARLMVKMIENRVEESTVPVLPWSILSTVIKQLPSRVIKWFA